MCDGILDGERRNNEEAIFKKILKTDWRHRATDSRRGTPNIYDNIVKVP